MHIAQYAINDLRSFKVVWDILHHKENMQVHTNEIPLTSNIRSISVTSAAFDKIADELWEDRIAAKAWAYENAIIMMHDGEWVGILRGIK